jgi:hypothetical protein
MTQSFSDLVALSLILLFLTSYGTNRWTVHCVSVAFQQQICGVLTAVRCHCAAPTVANLIQQSTTIDTEREKESEEIGGED